MPAPALSFQPPSAPTEGTTDARLSSHPLRSRGFVAALAVGFALRVAWSIWAVGEPTGYFSDAGMYIRMARDFAQGNTPTFGAYHTATFPPGLPILLAPFAWFSEHVTSIDLSAVGAGLNVIAGTLTIVATAQLSAMWLGRRTLLPAAWLMALCPAHIYVTSAVVTETIGTAVAVWAVLLLSRSYLQPPQGRRRSLVLAGLVVGAALLVRNPTAVLLAAPALVVRGASGRWSGAWRATLLTVAGASLLLVPWAIRNGTQVGVWSPFSTNNATVVCVGNRDGATGQWQESLDIYRGCYRLSPWHQLDLYEPGQFPEGLELTPVDESRWYRDRMSEAVRWAVRHPVQEAELVLRKTWATVKDEDDAIVVALTVADPPKISSATQRDLTLLANAWYVLVLGLAVCALVRLGRARRAVPLWALPLIVVASVWPGVAFAHYHHLAIPFLACLAAAALAAVGRAETPERSVDTGESEEPASTPTAGDGGPHAAHCGL